MSEGRTVIGPADLLRALEDGGNSGDDDLIADLLGFFRASEPRPRVQEAETRSSLQEQEQEQRLGPVEIESIPQPRTPFWRVVEVVDGEQEIPTGDSIATPPPLAALSKDDIGRDSEAGPAPRHVPIVPWERLRRAMEDVCRRPRPVGDVDVDVAVDLLSRGQPVLRVPRRSRRVQPSRLVVVFDRAERLIPFWLDQVEVYVRLRTELGSEGLLRAWWTDGPPRDGTDAALVGSVHPRLERGDVVLVLGDLGHYGTRDTRLAWAALGAALNRHGIMAAALIPCPADRWDEDVVGDWRAIDWSNPTGVRDLVPTDSNQRNERRDRLLALVSLAARLEPGLLRAVRAALPPAIADIGTEADVWCHPGVELKGNADAETDADARRPAGVAWHSEGLLISASLREHGRERLRAMMQEGHEDGPHVRASLQIMRRWHAPLPRELWTDEARAMLLLGDPMGLIDPEERERVESFTRKVQAHLVQGVAVGPVLRASVDVRGWVDHSIERLPAESWRHGGLGKALVETWHALAPDDRVRRLPPGMEIWMLPTDESRVARSVTLWQRAGALVLGGGAEAQASPFGVTLRARARVSVGREAYDWPNERVASLEIELPDSGELVVKTDCGGRVKLRLESKPAWAEAMGRDREGLWVEYRGWRLEWPAWAREVGEDGFGVWATLVVGEVEQRFRWIAPGTFVMGSPESEEGRDEDEGPQHEVTLTEGYWLADTPCTQAMWQAVMGNNPSEYQSPRRPVEKVSWDDVQGFLAKLNEAAPGLNAGLPSEAQWEYACRAGTTTATYAGDLRILGENNAPLLDDIAWYGGNSGVGYELEEGYNSSSWPNKQHAHTRAGTREVGLKRPNPWGLYDMLGNVLEWCADMPRDYTTAAETDPQGTRGPERIDRGGGWGSDARLVRAARRFWSDPGYRVDSLGFRLVRGQGLRKQAKPATRQQGREQGRGTSPASPGGRGKKGV